MRDSGCDQGQDKRSTDRDAQCPTSSPVRPGVTIIAAAECLCAYSDPASVASAFHPDRQQDLCCAFVAEAIVRLAHRSVFSPHYKHHDRSSHRSWTCRFRHAAMELVRGSTNALATWRTVFPIRQGRPIGPAPGYSLQRPQQSSWSLRYRLCSNPRVQGVLQR